MAIMFEKEKTVLCIRIHGFLDRLLCI